jgi:hypothetical protein
MGTRGRKNIYELTMGSKQIDQRPDAPYCLTDAEAEVWRAIVNSKPPDQFGPSGSCFLLIQLCRHKVAADRIAMLIQALCRKRTLDLKEFTALAAMQANETTNIICMSRQLRLTPQAIYRADSAKLRPLVTHQLPKPWDRRYDEDKD